MLHSNWQSMALSFEAIIDNSISSNLSELEVSNIDDETRESYREPSEA